jgi:PAS domain S-box-containing protein
MFNRISSLVASRASEARPQDYGAGGYIAAIALVLAAALLRLEFLPFLGMGFTFVTFYPAVMLAALYGGFRAGVLATLLSALVADYFWIETAYSFVPANLGGWTGLSIFVAFNVLVSGVAARLQQTSDRLRQVEASQRDELNRLVAERTAQLRESEARLQAIVGTAVDAIIVIDEAGQVQSVNAAGEQIFGYMAEEVIGKNVAMLMPEPHRPAHDNYLQAYRRTGYTKIIVIGREVEGCRKDGSMFAADLTVAEWRVAGKRYFTGTIRDITERKRHEEQIGLLMREVNHRAKNMLAVVMAVARQTLASTPQEFISRFGERIKALAVSQDLLVKNEWRGVPIEELVRSQLAHFSDLIGTRIELHGPSLLISASAAQTIGMTLHELATNAGKYGALSNGDGQLQIEWLCSAIP